MDGEFKVELKDYNAAKIIGSFKEYYGNRLAEAYARSKYQLSGLIKEEGFCAGHHTHDSLFLVYNREGTWLKVYVETVNRQDINNLKNIINSYFKIITKMLDKKKIKWLNPQATIRVQNIPLPGVFQTRKKYLKQIFEDQREKLFLVPIGSVLASFLAIHWNILDKVESSSDLKKTVSSTLEAYIGLILLFLIKLLWVGNNREFSFKI